MNHLEITDSNAALAILFLCLIYILVIFISIRRSRRQHQDIEKNWSHEYNSDDNTWHEPEDQTLKCKPYHRDPFDRYFDHLAIEVREHSRQQPSRHSRAMQDDQDTPNID